MPVLGWEQIWSLHWRFRHLIINILEVSVGVETEQALSGLLLNSHTLGKVDWSLEVWNFEEPSVCLLVQDLLVEVIDDVIEIPGDQWVQVSNSHVENKPVELIKNRLDIWITHLDINCTQLSKFVIVQESPGHFISINK